jgi:two-component system nitrogen regulation response regulator NtrX
MLNILIIDDQPLLAKWLGEDLLDEKYQISRITDVDDIYDDIAEIKPDIIFLDVWIGGFERWDILNQIKLISPNIPILILGSYDSIADDPRLDKADGYIIKDIYMDVFKDKMKALCRPNI